MIARGGAENDLARAENAEGAENDLARAENAEGAENDLARAENAEGAEMLSFDLLRSPRLRVGSI